VGARVDFHRLIDWFIPENIKRSDSDRLMARTFVLLHLLGPLMGHSVTWFLSKTAAASTWQLWVIEAMVASFWLVPLLLRQLKSMRVAATVTVNMLVALSLFGSFSFGGISSPFLPWFLIAMVLGFFYLANSARAILSGIAAQLGAFFLCRILLGEFSNLVPVEELRYATLLSIIAALTYMTMLTLYYETVMRISLRMEQDAIEQRNRLTNLHTAMAAAELASKRKSIFLAKMSHELRTPLNAVIGYTEMLRETFEDMGTQGRKMEDLSRIHAAGNHLLALVDDVIDLNSIESNKMELVTQQTNLRELIDEVAATASPLARKRENRLIVNMPEDLGEIELDSLKLRQCILNLLSNAAKFTTKGTIMLTILRKADSARNVMLIEVTDNGIGISQEGLAKLFVDYAQAESDTSSRFGGTGLGLALTKRFCEMMGGSISVRSERGVGTSFSIEIPYATASQPHVADAKRTAAGHA
jgi:signal transduction histidine kinase